MKQILSAILLSLCILMGLGFCISIPERPVVTFDKQPSFTPQIANPTQALTFAYDKNRTVLLVISEHEEKGIKAIALDGDFSDAFDALNSYGHEKLTTLAQEEIQNTKHKKEALWYPLKELAPITENTWNIAFGGNFTAHANETELTQPFAFPKIVKPSPPISTITVPHKEALLDYEVELCMTFDRDIRTNIDFRLAKKGLFLCADTTDRTTLLRDLPADEETFGGSGFTDAKSFNGFLSTGSYLVIPNNWKTFVKNQPITTTINNTLMQYIYGADMLFDFEEIVSFTLKHWNKRYWETQNHTVKLLPNGIIERGSALLSGTGDGVIFRPPTSANDFICGGTAYVCTGAFINGITARNYVIERFIHRHLKAKTFIQPGEKVIHQSRNLGTISISVR